MSQEAPLNDDEQFNEEEGHEEEEFNDDDIPDTDTPELIISSNYSDDVENPDEMIARRQKELEELEKQKELERQRQLKLVQTEQLSARFHPTTSAAQLILEEYRIFINSKADNLPFKAEPINNNLFTWDVFITRYPKNSDLSRDMSKYREMNKGSKHTNIELKVLFPPDYPNHPPFVYVVRPRFQHQTGRITAGGSICTTYLTDEGWTPANSLLSLMTALVTDIFDGHPRIELGYDVPYSLQEAKEAYVRVARDHHWTPSSWLP